MAASGSPSWGHAPSGRPSSPLRLALERREAAAQLPHPVQPRPEHVPPAARRAARPGPPPRQHLAGGAGSAGPAGAARRRGSPRSSGDPASLATIRSRCWSTRARSPASRSASIGASLGPGARPRYASPDAPQRSAARGPPAAGQRHGQGRGSRGRDRRVRRSRCSPTTRPRGAAGPSPPTELPGVPRAARRPRHRALVHPRAVPREPRRPRADASTSGRSSCSSTSSGSPRVRGARS